MSKRLQVVMSDSEWKALQRLARKKGVALSEWVRQALRRASQNDAVGPVDARLAAVRGGARYGFPAPDIDQMLAEIERGYR